MNEAATDPGLEARRTGLDEAEAARRLAAEGPNALPDASRRGWRAIAANAAREPMFLLLLGAALLYLLLGEARESLFLLLMVVLMLGMTLYQEGRTEHALQALRALSAPSATVVRGGRRRRLPASELVRGDLVALAEGDRVPADALLVEANGLLADESLLTGESVAVAKRAGSADEAPAAPGGDGLPWVYAGTLVVQGAGLALVSATGPHSELGRIGASLGQIAAPAGRLQRETRLLAGRLAMAGFAASLLLVLLLGLRGGDWLQALLAGVALSMSVLPEEFPVILTVFPALGAWRLARRRVLARRLAAIEILGSTSVLCVDKTGTLTENRMALRLLWRDGQSHALAKGDAAAAGPGAMPPPLRALLMAALHASRPESADPIEAALRQAAGAAASSVPCTLLLEYGLTPARPALVRIRREDGGASAAIKGAPETVIALCGGDGQERALQAAAALAGEGLKVLAVAEARGLAPPWPEDPAGLPWQLLGLVALADPLRPDIPAAVAACRDAGLRLIMLTGDHPQTARAIARQAGLTEGGVLTGAAIARLDAAALAARLDGVSVCARILPSQKLEIVRALQRGGAVVAMTGDGVNDAPALRAADVGVAMGQRGTDVAREAADMVLLDDRFASLVEALQAGRRIFGNMRKSMGYVAAIHVPIAALALLPALLGWPALLYPLHIVFLELVIDPACSLAFENEPAEADLMRRPPRPQGEALFGRTALLEALLAGLWAALLGAACYALALARLPEAQARAVGFAALVLCNLALLLAQRQSGGAAAALRTGNPVFLAIAGGALLMLGCTLYLPALAALFRFAPPPAAWLALAPLAALALTLGLTLGRAAGRHARRRPGAGLHT